MATATERWWTQLTSSALLLGIVHASVDLASGYLVFRDAYTLPSPHESLVYLAIFYNTLAFGGQAPLGVLADRLRRYREMGMLGAVLAAVALVVAPYAAALGVVIIGIGNAMFHVGAGAFVLRESGNRSTESGVFVGPGAIGLASGVLLGLHQVPVRWFIVAALVAGAAFVPSMTRLVPKRVPSIELPRVQSWLYLAAIGAAVCLVSSVTVRALIGGTVAGAWRGVSTPVLVALAIAACGGKMLGGFLGDRWGWATVSVAALVLSAPLVSWLVTSPIGAILGMLVFQLTMPMTLKATHHILPTRPGLAFGIPCSALLVGALPGLLRALPGFRGLQPLPTPLHVFACVLVSAVLVGFGLRLVGRAGANSGPASERIRWLRPPTPQPAE